MYEELKPCPFCGGEASHSLAVGDKKYRTVGCINDDCLVPRIYWERDDVSEADAVRYWNTRTPDAGP